MYEVGYWDSHPFEGNDDCLVGKTVGSFQDALGVIDDVKNGTDGEAKKFNPMFVTIREEGEFDVFEMILENPFYTEIDPDLDDPYDPREDQFLDSMMEDRISEMYI